MKIGRNDACPCGSGKKYKKCCLLVESNPFPVWHDNIATILCDKEPQQVELIQNVSIAMLEIIKRKNWTGACHATSALMYIIYRECGVDVELCAGETKFGDFVFDHSWLEIDNKVYDMAIYAPLNNLVKASAPVVAGVNVQSLNLTQGRYGIYFEGLGGIGSFVINASIVDYFDSAPDNMMWDMLRELANKANVTLDFNEVRTKYSSVKWTYKR